MKWLQARLVALVLTTALWATSSPALVSRTKEALIGWQGDSYRQADVFGGGEWGGERPKSRSAERWVETLTWTPRAFQVRLPSDLTDDTLDIASSVTAQS